MNPIHFEFVEGQFQGEMHAVEVKNPVNKETNIRPRKYSIHQLKILKKFYIDVFNGKKKAEVRKNDRGFREGDLIQFTVINNDYEIIDQPIQKYIITHVLNFEQGLNQGYVVLSIDKYKES